MPMSANNWHHASRPWTMLHALAGRASLRKQRLLGVACCRRISSQVAPPGFQDAIDAVEVVADDLGAEPVLEPFRVPDEVPWWSSSVVARLAARQYDPAHVLSWCGTLAQNRSERGEQCSIIRDIFGNPFQPVTFDPSWRTEAVVGLARGMYESRNYGPIAVLADALEDAGCPDADVLAHCRGSGSHVRGCWVVDLVLGKA